MVVKLIVVHSFSFYFQEFEARKQYMNILQKVADEPAMGQNELEVLNDKVID